MTHLFWYLARSAGFLTYLFTWGSVAWGLLLTTRFVPRADRATLYVLHRLLALGGLIFLGVHLYSLYLDPWADFSVRDLIVPFHADYRPLWMGCGIVTAYLALAVTMSSLLQARLPFVLWRGVHYLSFLAFVLGLAHGIGSGADTREPFALLIYGGTAAIVAGLCIVRVREGRHNARPASPSAAPGVKKLDPAALAFSDLRAQAQVNRREADAAARRVPR